MGDLRDRCFLSRDHGGMRLPGSYVSLVWVYFSDCPPKEIAWWRKHHKVVTQFWIPLGTAWLARIAGRRYAMSRNKEEGNHPCYTSSISDGEWLVCVSDEPQETT